MAGLFTVPSFDPSSSAKEAVEQIARMERFLGELTAPLGGMMTRYVLIFFGLGVLFSFLFSTAFLFPFCRI